MTCPVCKSHTSEIHGMGTQLMFLRCLGCGLRTVDRPEGVVLEGEPIKKQLTNANDNYGRGDDIA